MDLLDRLLRHDAWTTRLLLDLCASLPAESFDRDFDIGHRTLRATFDHVIHNMEIWSSLMAGESCVRQADQTISGMAQRLSVAEKRFQLIARRVADENRWDHVWEDHLEDPPREKSYGTGIAHLITHSMHHRAQILYMLRLSGVQSLPEGDVFSWENAESTE